MNGYVSSSFIAVMRHDDTDVCGKYSESCRADGAVHPGRTTIRQIRNTISTNALNGSHLLQIWQVCGGDSNDNSELADVGAGCTARHAIYMRNCCQVFLKGPENVAQ